MRAFIHDADGVTPGSWSLHPKHKDRKTVVIICPHCCERYAVGAGVPGMTHRIHEDGTVTPRVICRCKDVTGKPCDFYDVISLIEYRPIARPMDRH